MDIRAAVTRGEGAPFEVQEVQLEDPRPDEVVVRMVSAGVCHTDLIVRDQWYPTPLPAVLGHEGAGVVERVGSSVTGLSEGDHVALSFASCGRCDNCRSGAPAYCLHFFALNFGGGRLDESSPLSRDGEHLHGHFFGQSSFATHAVVAERNAVKLDPAVDLEMVGPLGCGVQTGAGSMLNVLRPDAGTSVVVFGAGAVGTSAVMGARILGATTIIAVDLRPKRLALAEELGATHTIDASSTDPVEAVQEITGGGADRSLESTGVPAVLRQAVDALAPRGVCGVVGAPKLGTEAALDVNDLIVPGRTVRGIVEGDSVPSVLIPRLLDLHAQGRFPFDRLVTTYGFDEIDAAAHDAEEGETIKPVLTFG